MHVHTNYTRACRIYIREIETWINQETELIETNDLATWLSLSILFHTFNVSLFIPFLATRLRGDSCSNSRKDKDLCLNSRKDKGKGKRNVEEELEGSWWTKGREGILMGGRILCFLRNPTRSTRWTKVITGNNSILSLPGAVYLPASAAD